MATTGDVRLEGIRIRAAVLEDWGRVSELLAEAKLVPLDETAQFGPQYAVAVDASGVIVGVAGYERYGKDILLRSVAVSHAYRARGIGCQLTTDRLADAASKGCQSAYLLTDTAKGYWERHGFAPIARAEAPRGITESREWSHACPESATAMFRRL
jgi:N-acetylglutamate synthase-like GNAT family acetyltransferase